MLGRKAPMDAVRAAITLMLDAEYALRRERKLASAQSVQRTWAVLVGLFVLAAGALALLSIRQVSAVARSYRQVLLDELKARRVIEGEAWLQAGQAQLAEQTQGELTIAQLGERVLRVLCEYGQAEVGAFFAESPLGWRRYAGFGLSEHAESGALFGKGEGLVGRAAASGALLHIKELPASYLRVRSGTGEHAPVEVVLLPARTDKQTLAVLELSARDLRHRLYAAGVVHGGHRLCLKHPAAARPDPRGPCSRLTGS